MTKPKRQANGRFAKRPRKWRTALAALKRAFDSDLTGILFFSAIVTLVATAIFGSVILSMQPAAPTPRAWTDENQRQWVAELHQRNPKIDLPDWPKP